MRRRFATLMRNISLSLPFRHLTTPQQFWSKLHVIKTDMILQHAKVISIPGACCLARKGCLLFEQCCRLDPSLTTHFSALGWLFHVIAYVWWSVLTKQSITARQKWIEFPCSLPFHSIRCCIKVSFSEKPYTRWNVPINRAHVKEAQYVPPPGVLFNLHVPEES